jgi:hypothetical protein
VAAAGAASGDTIDLRRLTCGRIGLVTGEIFLPQDNLTLLGPGRLALTVSGNRRFRVLEHAGTGTLRIQGLSLSYGYVEGPSVWGVCILSGGRVELRHSRVHHCFGHILHALEPDGEGAGIAANGSILLSYSSVFANTYDDTTYTGAGGVFTGNRLVMDHSQLYDNVSGGGGGGVALSGASLSYSIVQNNDAPGGSGGGLISGGDVVVNKSTISGNQAFECGGLCVGGEGTTVIADSTISGNAGLTSAVGAGSLTIYNSTVVRNSEPYQIEFPNGPPVCRGAVVAGRLRMESTIVAGNTCHGIAGPDVGALADSSLRVGGSHNLIGLSLAPIPADTLMTDPRIAPLAWNGGPTRTHALLFDSPARDRGNNVLNRQYDQRGPGYPRVKGASPDIGAYEY